MIKTCGAVVFRKHKGVTEYLLLRHIHSHGGHWDFPHGILEGNETEETAALREVKEESGLTIEFIPGFREAYAYVTKDKISKTAILFLGRAYVTAVTIQPTEIIDYRWLKFEDAVNKITFDSAKDVLRKAHVFIEGHNER
jgi:8-oxo-dGTP pyrophosphatase MutT (NUDIX family)